MSSNSQDHLGYLHELLDHELSVVKTTLDKQPAFEQIQNKLKKLEVKLESIKDENANKIRDISIRKSVGEKNKVKTGNSFNKKNRVSFHQQKNFGSLHKKASHNKFILTYESPPQNKAVKKSRSTINLPNSQKTHKNTQSLKKSKSKATRFHANSVTCEFNYNNKETNNTLSYCRSKKSISQYNSHKKTKTQKVEMIRMNEELEKFKKENKLLKDKVEILKDYERDFLKLVEVMKKGQKSRKSKLYR